jgi:hypothetical protein
MKTKTYIFTEEEMMTIRNAMIEYHHMIKTLKPNSPIAIRNMANAKALKDQFIQDAAII